MLKQIILPAVITFTTVVYAADCENLLDKKLSKFEVWMGIPHASVQALPEGTYQSTDVHNGKPMGLNADVKNVFSVIEESGELILKVSGEIYGGLITLKEYENYHLKVEMKWGEKKWEPRLRDKRDSGIIYHCQGQHGRFWQVWKAGLEFQVQESDLGDFIPVAGPSAQIRGFNDGNVARFDPSSEKYIPGVGYIHCTLEPDRPHGEWNTLEIYSVGDTAVHLVNGIVVMIVEKARDEKGAPLTRGQIQIQSEGAECYYKNFQLRPIAQFPSQIAKLIP